VIIFVCFSLSVDLLDYEYRSVSVRGEFIHDKELTLGPRKKQTEDDDNWMAGEGGFNIITPFKRSDTG